MVRENLSSLSRGAPPTMARISIDSHGDADSQANRVRGREHSTTTGATGPLDDLWSPLNAFAGPPLLRDNTSHQPRIAFNTASLRQPRPRKPPSRLSPVMAAEGREATNNTGQVHLPPPRRPPLSTYPSTTRSLSVFPKPYHSTRHGEALFAEPPETSGTLMPQSHFSDSSDDEGKKGRKSSFIPSGVSSSMIATPRRISTLIQSRFSPRGGTEVSPSAVPGDRRGGRGDPSGVLRQQAEERQPDERGRKVRRDSENRTRNRNPLWIDRERYNKFQRRSENRNRNPPRVDTERHERLHPHENNGEEQWRPPKGQQQQQRKSKERVAVSTGSGSKAANKIAKNINKALPEPPRASRLARYQSWLGGISQPVRDDKDHAMRPALHRKDITVLCNTAVDGGGDALVNTRRNAVELTPDVRVAARAATPELRAKRVQSWTRRQQHDANRPRWMTSPPSCFELPSGEELRFLASVCLVQMCTQAELGKTLAVLPSLARSFDPDNHLSGGELWLITAYTLAVGTFALISGRLGEKYGYRNTLIVGSAWCGMSSVIAGLSFYSTSGLFIFCRVMSGIGAALAASNALALLGEAYPQGRRKNLVFALFATGAPLGWILGAAFASALDLAWWPITFFASAAPYFIILAATWFTVRSDQTDKLATSFHFTMIDMDITGGIAGMSGLILVGYAVVQGISHEWTTPSIWLPFVVGCAMMALCALLDIHLADNPLVPTHALTINVTLVLAAVSCAWASCGIWLYYTWKFLELIRGLPPLQITVEFTPILVVSILASPITAILINSTTPVLVMTVSLTSFIVGVLLVVTMPESQVYWTQTFFSCIFMGLGVSTSLPAATVMLSNAVEKKYQGTAASFTCSLIQYSITLGLGLASTVEAVILKGENSRFLGYRSALYFSLGVAIVGLWACVSVIWRASISRSSHSEDDAATEKLSYV